VSGPPSPGRDVVEQGRAPREPHPRRTPRLVAGGLLVVLLAGGGAVVDHRVRAAESPRVAACRGAATSAVRYSDARVDAISSYVRPALDSDVRGPERQRLLGLVSISVAPTVPGVRRARARCAGVHVLWLHHRLVGTRRDCLRLLDQDLAYLGRVTSDGVHAFDVRSLPRGSCAGG
jgi:hypothetical protein